MVRLLILSLLVGAQWFVEAQAGPRHRQVQSWQEWDPAGYARAQRVAGGEWRPGPPISVRNLLNELNTVITQPEIYQVRDNGVALPTRQIRTSTRILRAALKKQSLTVTLVNRRGQTLRVTWSRETVANKARALTKQLVGTNVWKCHPPAQRNAEVSFGTHPATGLPCPVFSTPSPLPLLPAGEPIPARYSASHGN